MTKELDDLEKALEPRRIIKIFVSLFLIAILGVVLVFGVKMAMNTADSVEAVSRDHSWFASSFEQIQSLESQIAETKTALDKHQAQVETRWISRSDDRQETQRLTHLLLDLTKQRADLIKSYNSAAELVAPDILGTLPKRVEPALEAPVEENE